MSARRVRHDHAVAAANAGDRVAHLLDDACAFVSENQR
jgi:hypothetical protein